ncbi:hypothetical protein P3T39_004593 [Kitasatospora sp. GP82]|nr:hypothetical protein [Kitasatospora sp. GP82]
MECGALLPAWADRNPAALARLGAVGAVRMRPHT